MIKNQIKEDIKNALLQKSKYSNFYLGVTNPHRAKVIHIAFRKDNSCACNPLFKIVKEVSIFHHDKNLKDVPLCKNCKMFYEIFGEKNEQKKFLRSKISEGEL